jgi:predicted GTPase
LDIYEVQTEQRLDNIPEAEITNVLIVGMTGVGKSTYLNALVNHFFGIEMEDNFRYIVTRDVFNNVNGKSSTNKVNIYGLPKQGKMKKNIRLIDIPGLGDTGGIQKDKEHLKMIKQSIEKTVPYINLIIYVFKASDTRVTK